MVLPHRLMTAVVDELPLEEKFVRNESCIDDDL